jgi:putative membrane protein|tara:strand:- start:408 stop:1025 length:618 start_codon:yes stop_codon:yes gene_type:complete
MTSTLQINHRNFIVYKFFNSLFTGVSVGSIFVIYSDNIDPSIYSLGGIVLASLMMLVSLMYSKILNNHYFFRISLFVEVILFIMVLYFLIFSYSPLTSLLIYCGYQLSFVFGSYLIRAETLALKNNKILTWVDLSKNAGYLVGLAISFFFYKIIELDFNFQIMNYEIRGLNITDNNLQVYNIHYLLVFLEIVIIYSLIKSFRKEN